MKWFSWLFNFFSKPLEKSVVVGTIHLHDMEDWLALEKHHLISKYKLNSEIISYTNRLKDKRWELECKLDEWQQKIPLGKRDDVNYFFVETRKFLDEISFTEELEVDTVMQMNRKLEPMLIELIASIEEDDFATHFSFLSDGTDSTSEYDNLNPLLKELRVLNDSLTKFEQKITTTGIKTLENIEKKVEQLEGYTEQMHKQQKKFKLMKDRLQTAEAIKEEKESELIKLKQEENYKEISHLEKQREYLRKERDKLDDEVFSFFSRLKFILEKYLELQPHNLQVSSYIEDPVSAFLLDEGLGILHNLEHLKALLQQEKIKISPDELKQVSELLEKA
ncbi:hypothetical protein HYX12_04660, partial [Candidatus Woesearchaeota archaeon]|nr:hypothetical protein [Candidatus Woesearchaeota archaeon]